MNYICARNITIKVASSVAYTHGSHEQLHRHPILGGYTVVEVDEIVDQYRHVDVDYLAEEGANTIRENEHIFIAWEKAYIVFPPGTAPENLFSPRHPESLSPQRSPSPQPSPRRSPPPQPSPQRSPLLKKLASSRSQPSARKT